MPIFKTTLNVESTNTSATPLKLTSTINNDLTDNVTMGQVTVNSNTLTDINPESNGAKGSYLYVKSSSTNPKHTSIIIHVNVKTNPITLFAGEYALIPLSATQGPLMAKTSYGTAELEYFHGSRGEEIGESRIVLYGNETTGKWEFFTIDASTSIPGPIVETNRLYSDWAYTETYVVNGKGYIISLLDPITDERKYLFVNRRGLLIHEVTGTGSYNYTMWTGGGRAQLLTWYDNGNGHAVYFDGDSWVEHEFNNIDNIYVDNNWDDCAADGTFTVYIEGYNGNGDIEALFFVNSTKTLIKTTDFSNNEEYSNSYAHTHANFIAVETFEYNSIAGIDYLQTLEIFNTDGILLKSVDFNNMPLSMSNYNFYGSGKFQIVHQNDDNGDFIFLNYNQLTGKLIGDDLQWKSNYNAFEVICDSYYTSSSIDYKPESVAIILHNDDGYDSDMFLSQNTDGSLEVTYIINNDLEPRNYVVPNAENGFYASNQNNTILRASINDFILLSADSRDSGPLVATRFASGVEPAKFTLIPQLSDYYTNDQNDNDNRDVISRSFGDYRYLSIRKDTGNQTRDFIVYDSKILDTLSNVSDNNSVDREFNSMTLEDQDANKHWYFNTSTKKWVLLPGNLSFSTGISNEGSQFPVDLGKILLTRMVANPTSESIYARFITRGVASNEKEILRVGNTPGFELSNWLYQLSTETFVLMYKETSNSTWKAKVFDLNLNFLYEIDTQQDSVWLSNNSGKINHYSFIYSNGGNVYTFYNFNKLLNVKTIDYSVLNITTRSNNF
ncbi:MAG: hypothetical protein ACOVOV_17815 [Dolichospermum sp.]